MTELWRLEDEVRGKDADSSATLRQQKSTPIDIKIPTFALEGSARAANVGIRPLALVCVLCVREYLLYYFDKLCTADHELQIASKKPFDTLKFPNLLGFTYTQAAR